MSYGVPAAYHRSAIIASGSRRRWTRTHRTYSDFYAKSYGRRADADRIDSAAHDAHTSTNTLSAYAKKACDFAIGDDLRAATDANNSWQSRLMRGGMIAGNLLGPEEFGLKAAGKGLFVLTGHVGDALAGRLAGNVGRLVIEQGAKPSKNELRVASELVREGRTVVSQAASKRHGIKTADFLVDGKLTELKTISNLASPNLSTGLSNRIREAADQAPNIIIDARAQSGLTQAQAQLAIRRVMASPDASKMSTIRILGQGFEEHLGKVSK